MRPQRAHNRLCTHRNRISTDKSALSEETPLGMGPKGPLQFQPTTAFLVGCTSLVRDIRPSTARSKVRNCGPLREVATTLLIGG